ncbi:hypothetical protein EC990670_2798 [Escherichia coli 99.0670]|nr:hypothetical protein EC990670_3287 [Escherichia coli 99.0670]ELW42402.1 hypothetical protein EC990670_2798 [Escherichia coli 99.0670]
MFPCQRHERPPQHVIINQQVMQIAIVPVKAGYAPAYHHRIIVTALWT